MVDMASVQVKGQLDFDIVQSNCISVDVPSKSKVELVDVPMLESVMSLLMQGAAMTNVAFTFSFNVSVRNVALWVHQFVLSQLPYLFSFIGKLQDVEGSADSSSSGVKSTHMVEYSIESYCSLIRFFYTRIIVLEVYLGDVAIGCPPNKPCNGSC